MELVKVTRCCHRKSALAVYKGKGFTMEVYLRNNVPCKNLWGVLNIACYVTPTQSKYYNLSRNNNLSRNRSEFTSYADFRNYRKSLSVQS